MPRTPSPRTSAPLLLLLVALLGLAACGTDTKAGDAATASPGTASAPRFTRYVALGDSYTAAPYVPLSDVAQGCIRSNGNYPSILAKTLRVGSFVDVSCSGADTGDLTGSQKTFRDIAVPAQEDALSAKTDLVTVGIGGNDEGLFSQLFQLCSPTALTCTVTTARDDLTTKLDALGPTLVRSLEGIRRMAPKAKILLVGYPKLAPDSGTCATLPKFDAAGLALVNQANKRLGDVMKASASAAGVGYVDLYAASRGHDICSATPWINGDRTDTRAALALHPFAREQAAVAKLVQQQLG